jgi:glycerophosphoryl diester phosphodiesterase
MKYKKIFVTIVSFCLIILISVIVEVFIHNKIQVKSDKSDVIQLQKIIDNNKLIGHRGVPSFALESTIPSWKKCGETPGYIGCETDVWMTKDNKFVCAHDVNPFKYHRDLKITDLTYAQTQKYYLTKSDDLPFVHVGQYRIPTFEDFIKTVAESHKTIVFEIKDKRVKLEQIRELLDIIKKYDALASPLDNAREKTLIINSFYESVANDLLKVANGEVFNGEYKGTFTPEILLCSNKQDINDTNSINCAGQKNTHEYIDKGLSISPGDDFASNESNEYGINITKSLVDYAHQKNVRVDPWTIWNVGNEQTKGTAIYMYNLGVDAMFVNYIVAGPGYTTDNSGKVIKE